MSRRCKEDGRIALLWMAMNCEIHASADLLDMPSRLWNGWVAHPFFVAPTNTFLMNILCLTVLRIKGGTQL
jgi:hypothetical protein